MKKIIVAIDGYSSTGKSTIAKELARYAGYTYVDTGAMYRAVALFINRLRNTGEELRDEEIIALLPQIQIGFIHVNDEQHVTLNGEDVEGQIRTLEVGNLASHISQIKEVRAFLVAQQQAMGKEKGIVMDGRDIGTVVFPEAEFKIFITASPEVRTFRRWRELRQKGNTEITMEEVRADVEDRDYRDTHREESPLRQADDAFVLDNSNMELPDQYDMLEKMLDIIREK